MNLAIGMGFQEYSDFENVDVASLVRVHDDSAELVPRHGVRAFQRRNLDGCIHRMGPSDPVHVLTFLASTLLVGTGWAFVGGKVCVAYICQRHGPKKAMAGN